MQTSLLRLPEVQRRVGLGRSSIYRDVKAGTFPAPIRVTPGAVAWVSDEIDRWVAGRIAAARSEPTAPVVA